MKQLNIVALLADARTLRSRLKRSSCAEAHHKWRTPIS